MDMNELYYAEQAEMIKAGAANDSESRQNAFDQVAHFAARIRDLRQSLRQAEPNEPNPTGPVIDGTGNEREDPTPPSPLASWDNEGGAIAPPVALAANDTALKLPPRYFVGMGEYSSLSLAVEAHVHQKLDENP